MQLLVLSLGFLLTLSATAIMSYISMATAIGPWIETTLVFFGLLLMGMVHRWYTFENRTKALGLTVAAGGIGGILAVGCGFAFPTYYFLAPESFKELMNKPGEFALVLSLAAGAAGSFGLLMAHYFEKSLLDGQGLAFPIGELVYKMIGAADNAARTLLLAAGFVLTQIYLGLLTFTSYAAKPIIVLAQRSLGPFTLPSIGLPASKCPLIRAQDLSSYRKSGDQRGGRTEALRHRSFLSK